MVRPKKAFKRHSEMREIMLILSKHKMAEDF
jgi:hypothetical protein